MGKPNKRQVARKRRHARVREHLEGSPERPRLNVHRSLNHIYVQLIDDSRGHTLLAVSSLDPSLRKSLGGKTKIEQWTFRPSRGAASVKIEGRLRALDRHAPQCFHHVVAHQIPAAGIAKAGVETDAAPKMAQRVAGNDVLEPVEPEQNACHHRHGQVSSVKSNNPDRP